MKQVVAVREKKKNRSKGHSIALGIFALIGIVFGIVCVINPMQEVSMPTMGCILIGVGALVGALIPVILKVGKRIDKTNSYPEQAIVIEDETLYILTDTLTKIPLKDIKKVHYAREQNVGVFFRVIKSTGTLQIKTQQQTYSLTQISNVADSAKLIKSYLKK